MLDCTSLLPFFLLQYLAVNYCHYKPQLAGGSISQVCFHLELNSRKIKNSEYALHQD